MSFEERDALRDAVRGLLSGHATGADAGLWPRLCKEIGVAGLAVPEEYGGAGATLLETHVVLEELGRTLTPAPMLGCGVLATQALLLTGDRDACARLLPGICAGERIVAVAWDPPFTVAPDGRLSGLARQVLDAGDTMLAATDEALYEVDATAIATDSLDLTRSLYELHLDDAPARRLAGGFSVPALRDVALVALSAEQVGAAERALELTVEYTKTRVQFGRPIGSFQVLQHRLAEAHVRLEAARAASWSAAEALVAGAADAPTLAAMAKVTCSETFQAIAAEMTQMHGGIAITWEHDAHLYLRRAWSTAQLFGAPTQHVRRLAAQLLPA
jgi:alkylation response protein AidB-like acyl-CoA dehydrogenase